MDKQAPLSVTDALNLAKQSLENINITMVGEVSECSGERSNYKAVYFTIADASSSVPCMIWNNVYSRLGFKIERGALVEVSGRFTVYAPKGRMNFMVSRMNLAGEGALRLRVAELARKLAAEGLMEPSRRRPLPQFPQRIGLVTSPHGKAVHDVLRTLRRRFPLAEVSLAGVTVEGNTAVPALLSGLQTLQDAGVQLILLVRGGGSYEDLMPFNDESLARAIAASVVPVVTGIGHEPDTTIADMVADLRASTPTAAAEAVVPDCAELQAWLRNLNTRMQACWHSGWQKSRERLQALGSRPVLRDPLSLYLGQALNLEQSAMRLHQALPQALRADEQKLMFSNTSLKRIGSELFTQKTILLNGCQSSLGKPPRSLELSRNSVALQSAKLESLSPLAVLARGYAAAYDYNDKVVSSIAAVRPGDQIKVRVKDGRLNCTIDSCEEQQ
jgi:exodeoxyribonuclease VII large subunit